MSLILFILLFGGVTTVVYTNLDSAPVECKDSYKAAHDALTADGWQVQPQTAQSGPNGEQGIYYTHPLEPTIAVHELFLPTEAGDPPPNYPYTKVDVCYPDPTNPDYLFNHWRGRLPIVNEPPVGDKA